MDAKDPETDAEWREAVNAAHFWMLVIDARLYGLIKGGPVVDEDRCRRILEEGRRRGIFPERA